MDLRLALLMNFYLTPFYTDTVVGSLNQSSKALTGTSIMHVYSFILVVSLLVPGLAINYRNLELQSIWTQRASLAQDLPASAECPDRSKSPLPGCGRRDS